MRNGQKVGSEKTKNFRTLGCRLTAFLPGTISFLLATLNCFGANGVGSTNLSLAVRPEARISVQELTTEIRQDLGVEIRWVRVDLTLRMPSTGTTNLLLQNAGAGTNYVSEGTVNADQARAVDSPSDVILQPTKNGRYSVTLGITRSLDQTNDSVSNSNAVLELKSSDGSLEVSRVL